MLRREAVETSPWEPEVAEAILSGRSVSACPSRSSPIRKSYPRDPHSNALLAVLGGSPQPAASVEANGSLSKPEACGLPQREHLSELGQFGAFHERVGLCGCRWGCGG
jgi:hypothetical protein